MQRLVQVLIVLTVAQQSIAAQGANRLVYPPTKFVAELPGGVSGVEPTLNGRRLYYRVGTDSLWLYDVASKRSTRIATGPMSNLSASAQGNRIAFERPDEGGVGNSIWTIPLDPRTGLATAPARRASVGPASIPSVSPDGKWIACATQAGQLKLVVIPAEGGTERVLLTASAEIAKIFWSQDQQSLYFNVAGSATSGRTLQRIPVAGGNPVLLGKDHGNLMGISTDGKFLGAYTADADFAIMTATGNRIAMIPEADDWLSSSELMQYNVLRFGPINSVTLADGKVRQVLPATYANYGDLVWSPDGKRFAVLSYGQRGASSRDSTRLHIANADGSSPRVISLPNRTNILWSPDGSLIALYGWYGDAITVLNVGSGKTQRLRTQSDASVATARWTRDSKYVRYAASPWDSATRVSRIVIRQVGLDGTDIPVRTLANDERGLTFISDTTVLVSNDTMTYLRSLTSNRLVRMSGPSRGLSVSPRGDLLALAPPGARIGRAGRAGGAGRGPTADIVTVAGVRAGTVTFPGGGAGRRPMFTPDGKNLITWGRYEDDSGCCSLYMAPTDGGPVRTIAKSAPVLSSALSPDSKTLLFAPAGAISVVHVWSLNVSRLLSASGRN